MWRRATRLILPLGILIGGCMVAYLFVATRPVAVRKAPQAVAPQVRVLTVTEGDIPLTVQALGTVGAAKEVALRSRVSGSVLQISKDLQPGQVVKTGEELLRIDPSDYATALRRSEASYAKTKADMELEMGMQTVVKNEYKQLQQIMPNAAGASDPKLALRGPQLAQAQAQVDIAKADVEQAKTNLDRTRITAPFNALVTAVDVAPGQFAGTSDSLATLVGTDEYWINAAIPLDRMHLLGVYLTPEKTLPVRVIGSAGQEWEGLLLQSAGTLSEASRMGRILVSVQDPLNLLGAEKNTENSPENPEQQADLTTTNTGANPGAKQPLLLGDQVRVELVATTLENVIALPRLALRPGNSVWVVSPENTLNIQPVEVLWKDGDTAYIQKGLKAGDSIVVSDLAAPMNGMPVRPYLGPNNGAGSANAAQATGGAE